MEAWGWVVEWDWGWGSSEQSVWVPRWAYGTFILPSPPAIGACNQRIIEGIDLRGWTLRPACRLCLARRFAFGVGAGCGVGVGYGYGAGMGKRWDQTYVPPSKQLKAASKKAPVRTPHSQHRS